MLQTQDGLAGCKKQFFCPPSFYEKVFTTSDETSSTWCTFSFEVWITWPVVQNTIQKLACNPCYWLLLAHRKNVFFRQKSQLFTAVYVYFVVNFIDFVHLKELRIPLISKYCICLSLFLLPNNGKYMLIYLQR